MELYSTRTNFSIAIVAMVRIVSSSGTGNASDIEVKTPYCLRIQNNTETNDTAEEKTKELPPIPMTTTQRGNVLSAFFYAYGFSGIIGGRLAELYGTKKVFGLGVMVDAIGNFLIPITAKTHYGLLFFLRFTIGFFQWISE
ncbi:putative transporter [Armadillidium nasatum]|uniref:Putative transporter n=1 Tax=Armadillidium nasatum TaxID=96803 RepID=A0A5N5SP85_9CRUS|nr:putative transporter [Armadillidium nasatum]